MKDKKLNYDDLAIILAWPDATMRGDEKWMMFFRKIGVLKNLNFKVGHTAVVLIDSETKELLYYDFGRYISPRGYGRARSVLSDPRLKLNTKAQVDDKSQILNLEEIANEIDSIKHITQGFGRLYFSVAEGLNFGKAKAYADDLVIQGSMLYGAFARGNNNCSRFITRLLTHASRKFHPIHCIHFPESIKSSPMSNVVNARDDRMIYCLEENGTFRRLRMNRVQSAWFLLTQLADNFSKKKSALLPDDQEIGAMEIGIRPLNVPANAQWLGGVGEGAWFHITPNGHPGHFFVSRYTIDGELEYKHVFVPDENFNAEIPYEVTYDSHFLFTTVIQNGSKVRLTALKEIDPAESIVDEGVAVRAQEVS